MRYCVRAICGSCSGTANRTLSWLPDIVFGPPPVLTAACLRSLRVREAHERAQAFVSMCTRDAKQPLTSIKGTLVKFGSQKLLLLLLQKISPLFLRVTAQTGVHMIYEDGFCWVGLCVGLVRVVGGGKLC